MDANYPSEMRNILRESGLDGVGGPGRLYVGMAMSRALDERCLEVFPHWYPALGEEAVTIGTFEQLAPDDFAVPHYRGSMGVFWVRGMPLSTIVGGILNRENSVTKGRLSGLHGGDWRLRILPYVTNVIGPNVSTGVGLGLAEKLNERPGVSVVAFGDGTAGLGTIHESLNMAVVFGAPVVFVCQNNQYSISTRSSVVQSWNGIAEWARAYNLPADTIDGNDVIAVGESVEGALNRARSGEGPSLVEAVTFRMGGHYTGDRAAYQDEGERDAWRKRDPIVLLRERLVSEWGIRLGQVAAADEGVRKAVRQAWEHAESLPPVAGPNFDVDGVDSD